MGCRCAVYYINVTIHQRETFYNDGGIMYIWDLILIFFASAFIGYSLPEH